jgi:hypothetical protein
MQNQKQWTYMHFVKIIVVITIGYFLYYNYFNLLLFSHYC